MMSRTPSFAVNALIDGTLFKSMSEVITVNAEGICIRTCRKEAMGYIRKFV